MSARAFMVVINTAETHKMDTPIIFIPIFLLDIVMVFIGNLPGWLGLLSVEHTLNLNVDHLGITLHRVSLKG